MKKINLVFVILIFIFNRCTEETIDKPKDSDSQVPLTETLKLTSVVNLSDESKYLNSILELHENNTYKLSDNTGSEIISSTYERTASSITFNNGLFENYKVTMQITKLTGNELWLKEHYTLDNKDAYIEYHWTKN